MVDPDLLRTVHREVGDRLHREQQRRLRSGQGELAGANEQQYTRRLIADVIREHAEKLHAQLARPDEAVLLAVSPNQRLLEIVTGAKARQRIPDRAAKLAALSMSAAFAGGNLAGGIVTGIAQLASSAQRG